MPPLPVCARRSFSDAGALPVKRQRAETMDLGPAEVRKEATNEPAEVICGWKRIAGHCPAQPQLLLITMPTGASLPYNVSESGRGCKPRMPVELR